MKNFYLIPMVIDCNELYIDGQSLKSFLPEEIIESERKRIRIIYSTDITRKMPETVERKYEQHILETKELYERLQIPFYLIAYGNDRCAREILTERKIKSKYPAALAVRRVSKEEIQEYFVSSNYEKKIYNLFNGIEKKNEVPFEFDDEMEVEGYIDGEIKKQKVKGMFKGKIRVKK